MARLENINDPNRRVGDTRDNIVKSLLYKRLKRKRLASPPEGSRKNKRPALDEDNPGNYVARVVPNPVVKPARRSS
jgi:hypothetical protein